MIESSQKLKSLVLLFSMKIFVTGGTGFIGSYFLNQAHMEGYEIVALRRNPNSKPRIDLIADPLWLDKAMSEVDEEDLFGCEAVVHLAAFGATPQPATWEGCFLFNVVETLRLAEISDSSGIGRFIAAGSYAEYGKSGLRYDFIPVDAPLEPTDPYAASKAAASVALSAFANGVDMKLLYGRIFSAYGEGQFEGNLWPSLKKAALSGDDFRMTAGGQIRDFIDVREVASWFVDALSRPLEQNRAILFENVASGNPVSLVDFCSRWWGEFRASGKLLVGELAYRDGEVMRYVPAI